MLYFFKLVLLVVSLSSSFLVHANNEKKDIYFLIVKQNKEEVSDDLKTHLKEYIDLQPVSENSLNSNTIKFPSVFTSDKKSIRVGQSNDPNQKSLPLFEILHTIKVTSDNHEILKKLTKEWYANKKESSTEEIFIYNATDKITTFYEVMLSTTEKVAVGSILVAGLAATAYGAYKLPFIRNIPGHISQKGIPLVKNSWSCIAKGSSTAVKYAANYGSAIGTKCIGAAKYVWGMIPSFGRTSKV